MEWAERGESRNGANRGAGEFARCLPGRGRLASRARVAYPEPLQLGGHFLVPAVRADAVAEVDVGAAGEVFIDLLPVVVVVADLLAVGADGEQQAEAVDLGK